VGVELKGGCVLNSVVCVVVRVFEVELSSNVVEVDPVCRDGNVEW
jgi:hypothetical protein